MVKKIQKLHRHRLVTAVAVVVLVSAWRWLLSARSSTLAGGQAHVVCEQQAAWQAFLRTVGMDPPELLGVACDTISYYNSSGKVGCTLPPPSHAELTTVSNAAKAAMINDTFRRDWSLHVDPTAGLEWGYLATPDYQVRYQLAAKIIEMHSCVHVIEIGGFVTPLERYLTGTSSMHTITNMDPGITQRPALSNLLLPNGHCIRVVNLPLTIAEYMRYRQAWRPGTRSSFRTCITSLGYSVPHRAHDHDLKLFNDADVIVMETSTNAVHNEIALNVTIRRLTEPAGLASHSVVTDTRFALRDASVSTHKHGDNSKRRLVHLQRIRQTPDMQLYQAFATNQTHGRRFVPALMPWEGSKGQALCASPTKFDCSGSKTHDNIEREVAGGALCHKFFRRIPVVHSFAVPFARLLPLHEFGVCSQCGQDGVLAKIFEEVGIVTPGFYVEFGARIPNLLNSAYLRKHCGWQGLLLDGSPGNTTHSPCGLHNACEGIELVKAEFITAENVISVFQKHKVPAEFDLLTVDMDGQEYWVLETILKSGTYMPTVIAVEFNPNFFETESVTVPRNSSFIWDGTMYYGTSLMALKKLMHQHGYSYVYNLQFTHAMFVRSTFLHPFDRDIDLPKGQFRLHEPDHQQRIWEKV